MLAQHLVERYSGQDLPTFVAERIFGPLNMSSTTYSSEAANNSGRLTQSFSSSSRRIPTWITATDIPLIAGAGSMLSTVDDLANWAKLLLNSTTAPIPRAILDDCMTPRALMQGYDGTYGFGFMQRNYKGHHVSRLVSMQIIVNVVREQVVYHGGSLPGVSSLITVLPDDDTAIIQLANADSKGELNTEISNRIMASLFGIHADPSYTTPTDEDSPLAETYDDNENVLLDAFAGNYFDRGYGALSLCAPSSTTPACRSILERFKDVAGAFSPRALYASSNSFWVSHIRFSHTDNTTFNFVPTTLFPNGYGANTTSFELAEDAGPLSRAVFVCDQHGRVEGFGLFGQAGNVLDRERREGTMQEQAEVWFQRTGDLE
jgi:peroxiredoxin